MKDEEFQKLVLQKLGLLESGQKELKEELKEELKNVKTRQDEIFQVVRAIEHNNQVGRSEFDSQNIRLAKVEGKIKRVAKVYNEDVEVDKASNL